MSVFEEYGAFNVIIGQTCLGQTNHHITLAQGQYLYNVPFVVCQFSEGTNLQMYIPGRQLSLNTRKRTFCYMRPVKTQISLRICTVRPESLLSARRNFASLAIQNVPSEYSDQNARMRRLI